MNTRSAAEEALMLGKRQRWTRIIEDRKARLRAILEQHYAYKAGSKLDTVLVDLIIDVLHLQDPPNQIDLQYVLATADSLYQEERDMLSS